MIARPPVALLECKDEPVPPSLPGRELQSQRDTLVFDYILSLRSAWGDCKAKLAGVKAWSTTLP